MDGNDGKVGMKKDYIVELREEADELMNEHWVGELVLCKDCKHWERRECGSYGTCEERDGFFDADWFCADGVKNDA